MMDLVMLAELRNGSMSGYDAIGHIHNKFGVLISSGTIYSHLYALERDGLIEGKTDVKKRVYVITEKGENVLETISKTNVGLLKALRAVLNPLGTK
jgi:DNA-binding PadR family transcriptional regulator